MSTKKKVTPPPTKKKAAPVKTMKDFAKEGMARKDAAHAVEVPVVVQPRPTIPLPVPALLNERQEADTLIKKLTDTLPARLEQEVHMGQATEHLIITRKLRKAFEEHIKKEKKPFDEVIDGIKNEYGPVVARLKAAEDKLNLLITTYRTEATQRQQQEQRRRDEEHRKTMDEARAQGINPLSVPAPLPPPPPPMGFATAHGKSTTMRIPKWRVVDEGLIPYEFNGTKMWQLNEAGIGALRRGAGVEAVSPIPGIEFYYEETTVVK